MSSTPLFEPLQRRDLLRLGGLTSVTVLLGAVGARFGFASTKILRVGLLAISVYRGLTIPPSGVTLEQFLQQTLQASGYLEGKTVHLETRFGGNPEEDKLLARELIGMPVDVLFVF